MRLVLALVSHAPAVSLGLAALLYGAAPAARARVQSLETVDRRAAASVQNEHATPESSNVAGLRTPRVRTGDVRPWQLRPAARSASSASPFTPSQLDALDVARSHSATKPARWRPIGSDEPEPAPYDATGPPQTSHGQSTA